jgi:hypothetical protein
VPSPQPLRLCALWFGAVVCLILAAAAPAQETLRLPEGPQLPVNDGVPFPEETQGATVDDSVSMGAQYVQQWRLDEQTDAFLLRGRCRITQGAMTLSASQMVVWRTPAIKQGEAERLIVYLEGDARIEWPYHHQAQHTLLIELETLPGSTVVGRPPVMDVSATDDPVFQRARAERAASSRQELRPTQLIVPDPNAGPQLGAPWTPPTASVSRHVSINPRYLGQQFSANSHVSDSLPPERIITVSGGVNIVVDNVPVNVGGQLLWTTIDLSADSAVIWTDAEQGGDLAQGFNLGPDTPFRVYLEGNIVVRQGMNEARATQAYYDISERRGLLMNAEIRAFVPALDTFLRVRAQYVRQLSETDFHAQNAWVTTSQTGRPGYRVESSDVFLKERPGAMNYNPLTGRPEPSSLWVTSLNSRLFVEDVPVFYLPYVSAPAEDGQAPVRRLEFDYDGIFGFSVQSAWSLRGLGLPIPGGVDADLQLDYFSERGPAIGTLFDYKQEGGLFGVPTLNDGFGQFYYINDSGDDNLGLGRRNLNVPDDNRGRAMWRHRTDFDDGNWITNTWLNAELGYVSDRNFREQYFENEWDRDKDQETLVNLNHQYDNFTASGLIRTRLNDFEYQTDWLPRIDVTLLGEPLLNNWLTWSSHSSIGYGRIRPAEPPPDPNDPFQPLPFFPEVSGTVATTRHELDLPLNVGPVNIVPYLLGEASYWQEDMTGGELSRLYGSAGVKGSVMFWNAWPEIRDPLLGLNGLAHKMIFDFDYYYAQADEPLSSIAQYNEFDEDSQERFRTRFVLLEFGGVLPAQFDPRFYAVRTGAGRNVTAPYHELLDDQHVLRMGWRHRWQTKVGPPEQPRIKDWMTLDLEASYFPDPDRDNFGEDLGLLGGHYAWHVGERTTFLADALYDVFNGGQELWSLGILSQRSTRGSVYLGFRQVRVGPIDSQLVVSSFSYLMSPKWASTFGSSFDVAEGLDRGQSLTLTRIGEYALLHFGFGYDRSRNNVGIGISIEPRIGGYGPNSPQLSSLLGIP